MRNSCAGEIRNLVSPDGERRSVGANIDRIDAGLTRIADMVDSIIAELVVEPQSDDLRGTEVQVDIVTTSEHCARQIAEIEGRLGKLHALIAR